MRNLSEIPDRIITEADAKILSGLAVVAVLDEKFTISGNPEDDFSRAELVVENPVPVIDDTGETLGAATLSGLKVIEAHLFINGNTPVAFDIQNDVRPYYPHLTGEVLGVEEAGLFRVTTMKVSAVVLLPDPPVDARIHRVVIIG